VQRRSHLLLRRRGDGPPALHRGGCALSFTTSVTFDIKAFHDETHRALTGCPVAPVLRNARIIATEAPEKLWEIRVLVIPGINDGDILPLLEHLAGIDPRLPVAFLAFRPNHVLWDYPGASRTALNRCVEIAHAFGLHHAHWCGRPGIAGGYDHRGEGSGADRATAIAASAGCETAPRDCDSCSRVRTDSCPIRTYRPARST